MAERFQSALAREGIESEVYGGIAGEPTESSVLHAVEAARGGFDGFVGVGGGSALDTAKLCALFATHEGELLDYVNEPLGEGCRCRDRCFRSSPSRRPRARARR